MLNNALVSVEDDWSRMEPVIDSAVDILEAKNVSPILLHVIPTSEFEAYLNKMEYNSADPDDVASRHDVVQRAADRFHEVGLNPQIIGATGDPTKNIVASVKNHNVDHVFMGGRQRSPTGKAVLGSVSQGVLRGVDIPCTIVMS